MMLCWLPAGRGQILIVSRIQSCSPAFGRSKPFKTELKYLAFLRRCDKNEEENQRKKFDGMTRRHNEFRRLSPCYRTSLPGQGGPAWFPPNIDQLHSSETSLTGSLLDGTSAHGLLADE